MAATSSGARRRVSRRVQARRHRIRRWTAALLLGLASFAAVSAFAPAGPATAGAPTLVATRDVPAGTALVADDVTLVPRPAELRPHSALAAAGSAVGRVTAVPITANDVVTPERLAGPELLVGQPPDHVAVPLPVATVEGLGLGPGDRVDVYAVGSGARVATRAVVLATSATGSDTFGSAGPTIVTVSVPPSGAAAVAASLSGLDSGGMFTLALRRS